MSSSYWTMNKENENKADDYFSFRWSSVRRELDYNNSSAKGEINIEMANVEIPPQRVKSKQTYPTNFSLPISFLPTYRPTCANRCTQVSRKTSVHSIIPRYRFTPIDKPAVTHRPTSIRKHVPVYRPALDSRCTTV